MKKAVLLILCFVFLSCQTQDIKKQAHDPDCLTDSPQTVRTVVELAKVHETDKVRLSLGYIASLPPQTVFVAGDYGSGTGPICTALFVSRDGGKTWDPTGPRFESSYIGQFCTFGTSHIWGIVSFNIEGCNDPEWLIHIKDAGHTWSKTSLNLMHRPPVLTWVNRLKFFDAEHGILIFEGSNGGTATYYTTDGGEHWSFLLETEGKDIPSVEMGYAYPEATPKYPCSQIWEQQGDHYKIVGLIRLRRTDKCSVIEKYTYASDSTKWVECSRIPASYAFKNGSLAPLNITEDNEYFHVEIPGDITIVTEAQNSFIDRIKTLKREWNKAQIKKHLGDPATEKENELFYHYAEDLVEGGHYVNARIIFESGHIQDVKVGYGHETRGHQFE